MDVIQRRMEARLKHLGIHVRSIEEDEYVNICSISFWALTDSSMYSSVAVSSLSLYVYDLNESLDWYALRTNFWFCPGNALFQWVAYCQSSHKESLALAELLEWSILPLVLDTTFSLLSCNCSFQGSSSLSFFIRHTPASRTEASTTETNVFQLQKAQSFYLSSSISVSDHLCSNFILLFISPSMSPHYVFYVHL